MIGQDDLFAPIRETLLSKEDEHKPNKLQPLSSVRRRLLESAAREESRNIIFQHTVLAQTSLPYRNPGDDVRRWERTQGEVHLLVQAGVARHPRDRRWIEQGLPWGTKPRLILAHLNREALLNRPPSPEINVGTSLTAFVERIRGFEHGREIRAFKDQLTRLAAARISLANHYAEDRVCQIEARIVGSFDLWLEKDHRQRVLWPSTVVLSRSTSPACRNMPSRFPRRRAPPWHIRRSLWMFMRGWRSGCAESGQSVSSSSPGRR